MITYHLGTESETDVCAFDSATTRSWVVCSTNIEADRPYEDRGADATRIRDLLNGEAQHAENIRRRSAAVNLSR